MLLPGPGGGQQKCFGSVSGVICRRGQGLSGARNTWLSTRWASTQVGGGVCVRRRAHEQAATSCRGRAAAPLTSPQQNFTGTGHSTQYIQYTVHSIYSTVLYSRVVEYSTLLHRVYTFIHLLRPHLPSLAATSRSASRRHHRTEPALAPASRPLHRYDASQSNGERVKILRRWPPVNASSNRKGVMVA